jgi:hypothetical protein
MARRTTRASARPPSPSAESLADRVRRKIAERPGEYPPLSDEQVRTVAALLPPARPGSGAGQPGAGGDGDEG